MNPWLAFFIGGLVGFFVMAVVAGGTQNEKFNEEFQRGVEVGKMMK